MKRNINLPKPYATSLDSPPIMFKLAFNPLLRPLPRTVAKVGFPKSSIRFSSTAFTPKRAHYPRIKPHHSLVLGSASCLFYFSRKRAVLNDTATAYKPTVTIPKREPVTSRFNGKLNYQELSIGSITGLFLGIIVGKLSSAILFLSLSTYLLLQFLESRNVITIPWNAIINIGSEKINVKELILHKPSFKISFILSFIIAAYNI